MSEHERRKRGSRSTAWAFALVAIPIVYVLSSGPVLASAFWLREATGWDAFYVTMYLYIPLFYFAHDSPIGTCIEWWVELFDTVGPG